MLLRRLLCISFALLFVMASGMSGYMFIEHWPLLDSLYMTVITIASVEFMEVHPLTEQGRIFMIFLILGGTGVLVYGISTIIAFIAEGDLTHALRRRKMQNKIAAMKNHFIVCGVGQTGKYVLDEVVRTRKDVVAIDRDSAKIKLLSEQGICYVQGDATHNSVLKAAGIEKARGIVSALQLSDRGQ